MKKYPMLLTPVPKQILWGGDRLKKEYGKVADFDKIAESWELSVRANAMCTVANGVYSGVTLGELTQKDPSLLGRNAEKYDRFPLLIKFIDAADRLSIQVHPDDEYALAHEGEFGKNEMWYIIAAEEGAKLVYGLKDGCTAEEFARAVREDRTEETLNFVNVAAGETYYIPAGQVHAIGAGILIAEIQQNSDVTYRVYDYKRRQADGSLRQLHTEKAIDVVKILTEDDIRALRYAKPCTPGGEVLASCEYFTTRRYSLKNEAYDLPMTDDSFTSVLVLESRGACLRCDGVAYPVKKGESWFLPVGCPIVSVSGSGEFIVSTVN